MKSRVYYRVGQRRVRAVLNTIDKEALGESRAGRVGGEEFAEMHELRRREDVVSRAQQYFDFTRRCLFVEERPKVERGDEELKRAFETELCKCSKTWTRTGER